MKSGSIVVFGIILGSLLLQVWNPVHAEPVSVGRLNNNWDRHVYFESAPEVLEDEAICREGIEETLNRFPLDISSELETVILNFDDADPRGMANSSRIILRCDKPKAERLKVFIHEMGHVAYFNADEGVRDEYGKLWKKSSKDADFVSGYSKENEFEDFAESFLAFVDFGESFREAAYENEVLAEKYAFIEKYFLRDRVYQGRTAALENDERVFDLTKAL